MAHDLGDDDEDNILYELLIHAEWGLEPEVVGDDALSQRGSIFYRTLMYTPSNLLSLGSYIASSFWKQNSITPNLARILNSGSEWQLGVGAQGAVIAVLQDASLEVRAKKDEYASVVGKNHNLYNDPFPKWRRVSWSSECSMVAVAYSNGAVEIFNTVGVSLFTIYPPRFQEGKLQVDANNALAALIFSDVRTEKKKWASELIMIDFYGNVRGYFVSPTEGYQESHAASFHRLYPRGISAAVEIGSLIIVAGSCQYINDASLRNNGLGHGLSIWRMLNDYPFYKQVPTIDEDEYTPPRVSFLHHIPGFEPIPPYDTIFRLCVSPLGRQVAALHASGSLSVWDVPSLRRRKFWALETQPGFNIHNFDMSLMKRAIQKDVMTSTSLKNHLVDVKWWSEKAVTLARFSGAVTVCSVQSLTNLLGEYPEFFEGVPQISETHDRSFLALEMERTLVKSHSRSLINASESSEVSEESFTEEIQLYDERDLSFYQKTKLLTQNFLFWITDAESFRPFNKRQKVISRTCRLLCLKSTTPLELFTRKIENEEYGEALALAQRYNLDCDLVYHQQWRRSPVTVTTIQDYLSKIRKRSWVLNECLTRVPDDIDAARELILYGLRGTELDTLVGIDEGTNEDEFLVSDLSLDYEENPDLDPEEAEKEAQEWAANDLKKRRELLSKINFHKLSTDQIDVVRARQMLLKFFDRLSSYEVLLGGPHMASERYDPAFYERFRNQTELEAVVELARSGNWRGVEVMFTYHGEATLPHRLSILSNFPPTMGPYEYRSLLPECDLSGEVFEWEEELLRDPDWCEDSLCREAVGVETDIGLSLLYGENPALECFRDVEITSDIVSEWYKIRAKNMEESSHFVDAALDLLKLGRERNVPGLEELQNTFDTLEVLVYEVGLNDLSLKKFESLSDLEKLKLLMSTSTSETHIQNIRRWGQTFLNHCEKREKDLGKKLLKEYIVSTATQDLSIALKTIQHSQPEITDPILSSPGEVLQVALESIYGCDSEFQLPRAFAILECLPVRQPKKDSKELSELHDLVDDLEDHLGAAELLSTHGVVVSPSFIRSICEDEAKIKMLLRRLARTAARREIRLSNDDWNKLLSDMLEMQQKVFNVVEPQLCFELLTEALLTSGMEEYLDFAGELLETRADGSPVRNPYLQRLPYATAVQLIIKASIEYFNSSESYHDANMVLARHCLNMIESESEEVLAESDLISSLEILPDIGIQRLPLQVRLCEDRIDLIAEALRNHPENYKIGSKILRLASLMRVCGEDEKMRRAKVLTLIAEAAFKVRDYEAANSWCSQLVKGGHAEGWKICAHLGRCEASKDLTLRARFLDFALTHASFEYLEELLIARNEVELYLLYSRVSDRMEPNLSLDSDDGFEDARADSDEESCDEWQDPRPETPPPPPSFGSKRLLFSVTRNVLSATAASTSSLVSSVANKRMWKNAVGWLRPLRRMSSRASKIDISEQEGGNSDFTKQGCHAFYADLCHGSHISRLGTNYKSYAPPSICSPALDVSFTLLRIALIEESLCQGNSVQTNVTVIQEIVKGILQEDLLLGISFLLLLTSPQDVHDILSSFPRTEISLQVCLYYYALQIYTSLHPWQKCGIAPVFLHAPSDVISCVRSIVGQNDAFGSSDVMAYMEFFRRTDEMVNDYIQGQALQRLDAGIDIERFLADPDYKKDTLLGLAMSADENVIGLSLTLAKKYDVPLWEVYMTHLQFLFDSPDDISTDELRRLIQERNIMKYLKEKSSEFATAMERNIWFTISGKDHDRLSLYFSLLVQGVEDQTLKKTAETHIRLLSQIKDFAPSLDYKALLTPNASTLEILKPVLTQRNVDVLVQVAQNLPKTKEGVLEPSTVYCAWAQKHFFIVSEKHPRTSNDWIKRFDGLGEILKKLKAEDVTVLIKSLTLSEEATVRVPLDARKEIIKRAIKYCTMKSNNIQNDAEKQPWSDACLCFEKLEKHLDLLRSETFQKLVSDPNPKLREYAHQYMLSGGEQESLEKLSQKVLLDMCSFDVLRSTLAVFPEDVTQIPEDIFFDVLKLTLSNIAKDQSEDNECNTTEETERHCQVLSHLLKELKRYCDEGGDILDEDEVLDEIRRFAKNDKNTLSLRVRTLSIAQQFLTLNEEDKRLLQALKTGGIVRDAFSSPLKESQKKKNAQPLESSEVHTEEGRLELLKTLVDKMDSVKKAKSIIELLTIWPKFQPEVYCTSETNPWLQVSLKLLTSPKLRNEAKDYLHLVYSSTNYCIEHKQIADEDVLTLVEKLVELPGEEGLKPALKIAINSNNSEAQNIVIDKYKVLPKAEEKHFDNELLQLIIENALTASVLPTTLYGPLVTYLSEEDKPDLRRTVVDQLESAGYWIEAASLAVFSSSLPRAMKTASNAVQTFRRWL